MGVSTTHRINLSMWVLIYSFSDTYYVWAACGQTSNPIKRKICKLKWFQWREKCIMSCYSQLSPCGHLAITDTPIIRTAAESLAKNYRHFDWNKLPTLRTYRHLSIRISISTFRHFGRIISVYNIFLPLPLFVSVTLVEKWTFWFPFNMILLWNYCTYFRARCCDLWGR